jgi:hypothetical protein
MDPLNQEPINQEPSPQMNNQQSAENGQNSVRDVQATEPKPKKKKLKAIGAVVAAILVLGGITAALVVRSIYNKPENVVAAALADYLLDGADKNFDTKISLSMEEALMGIKDIELDANVQMAGKTTQIDLEMNASIITLQGSIQSNENGNLYVKVKDLPALLGTGALQAYGITGEMATQIAALDDKWIEIKPEDMEKLTGKKSGESALDKCTNSLYAALGNDTLGDSVSKMYKNNRFILAKSSSDEVVDGKKLLKVEVGVDSAKLDSFSAEMGKSEDIKKLASECGLADDESGSADSSSELKNGTMTVWVDRGKKELVKMEMSGDSFEDGQKVMNMKMVMGVKKPADKLEAPSDVVNIVTLLQQFGIDPSMFNASAQ